jgi:hypothetical protein
VALHLKPESRDLERFFERFKTMMARSKEFKPSATTYLKELSDCSVLKHISKKAIKED